MRREVYSWEHYKRLRKDEAKVDFVGSRKLYCKDVHSRDCPDCVTCHFCRHVL